MAFLLSYFTAFSFNEDVCTLRVVRTDKAKITDATVSLCSSAEIEVQCSNCRTSSVLDTHVQMCLGSAGKRWLVGQGLPTIRHPSPSFLPLGEFWVPAKIL
jgi:hypothetical protein